jgi:hypothetical protein
VLQVFNVKNLLFPIIVFSKFLIIYEQKAYQLFFHSGKKVLSLLFYIFDLCCTKVDLLRGSPDDLANGRLTHFSKGNRKCTRGGPSMARGGKMENMNCFKKNSKSLDQKATETL